MSAATAITEPSEPSADTIAADRIFEITNGFKSAKVLFSAVELGVFTALATGPLDLDTLTAEIGISKRGARDFFDTLVALRLVERDTCGRYRNTTETDCYLDQAKAHLHRRRARLLQPARIPALAFFDDGAQDRESAERGQRG